MNDSLIITLAMGSAVCTGGAYWAISMEAKKPSNKNFRILLIILFLISVFFIFQPIV